MTTKINLLYNRMINAFGIDGLSIPATAVKFYSKDEIIPVVILENAPGSITLTSCQATRQASLGDAVCLTKENIGCIAAAISFGLVDKNDERPMQGSRVYTDLMNGYLENSDSFSAPTPKDFTDGIVYACKDSDRLDFCLFGSEDSGRFKDVETAKQAIDEMTAIQPPEMKAVFIYSPEFNEVDLVPDVIVMSVRPVELARLVQAYQFMTGKRVNATMGAVRAVNSDLIVRPYLTNEINVSPYCVGARLIAKYEADKMGIGIPFDIFEKLVTALEESQSGYPFHLYPGAQD